MLNYPADWTYADFARELRAEFFGNYKAFFFFDLISEKFILLL
jgi:hypothetical protein